MAVVFACGAECLSGSGTANAGSIFRHWNADSGSGTITATNNSANAAPSGGTCYFQMVTSGGQSATKTVTLASQAIMVGRFYFNVQVLPDVEVSIFRVTVIGSSYDINLTTSGVVRLNIFNTNIGDLGPALATNTWHFVDFMFDSTTPSASVGWASLDGNTAVVSSTFNMTGQPSGFSLGVSTASTTTIRYDHVLIGNSAGHFPFGAGQITGYFPTTTSGTHNQTAGDLKNNSAANITNGDTSGGLVDEAPANTTDYVAQTVIRTTTYWEGIYGTSAVNFAPRAVEQVVYVTSSTTAADTEKSQLYDGTTATDMYALATVGSTSAVSRTKQWATPPSGGIWTPSLFQALRIRWGFSNDVTPNPRLTMTMIEAEFPVNQPPYRRDYPALLAQ